MENIINKIIDIDRKADERLVEANAESKKILENTEREAADLTENLRSAAEKRMTEVREFHKNDTDETLKKIETDCNEKLIQLDEAFENSHLSIEESIFRTIVGENIDQLY